MHLSFRRTRKRTPPTAVILSLTILALFTSTTIYMIASILFYLSQLLTKIAGLDLYYVEDELSIDMAAAFVKDYSPLHACASTATLTTNVRLPPRVRIRDPTYYKPYNHFPDIYRSYWEMRSCAGEHA